MICNKILLHCLKSGFLLFHSVFKVWYRFLISSKEDVMSLFGLISWLIVLQKHRIEDMVRHGRRSTERKKLTYGRRLGSAADGWEIIHGPTLAIRNGKYRTQRHYDRCPEHSYIEVQNLCNSCTAYFFDMSFGAGTRWL